MMELAAAAFKNIGPPGQESSSFLRYFNREDRSRVAAVFKAILGPNGAGQDILRWYTVYWENGDPTNTITTTNCRPDGSLLGYATRWVSPTPRDPHAQRAYMVLCPAVNWISTDASLCDRVTDQNHPRVPFVGFRSMARAMLHELTHWQRVIGCMSYGEISDFPIHPPYPLMSQPSNPLDGYGAWNAMLVRSRGFKAIYNADSYAWFALESWMLKIEVCGTRWKAFEDPIIAEWPNYTPSPQYPNII
jgi:hypothetical protein